MNNNSSHLCKTKPISLQPVSIGVIYNFMPACHPSLLALVWSMERRIAAVLIADVVGYGRLSQFDEEGTRARFQADFREIFEPRIADHQGRLVKTMGDGLLIEFLSSVNA